MHVLIAHYLRLAGLSLVALALAACAKLAPADGSFSGRPEPRLGEPPNAGQITAPTPSTAAERFALLEEQLETLDGQVANLRKALDVVGPLPDHPNIFIPVDKSEITGEVAAEPASQLAQLYAVAPRFDRSASLFFEAELGSYGSKAAAEAGWNRLAADNLTPGLQPRYAAVGSETRLSAGPLASEAAVNALCVELASVAGQCRVAAPIRAF